MSVFNYGPIKDRILVALEAGPMRCRDVVRRVIELAPDHQRPHGDVHAKHHYGTVNAALRSMEGDIFVTPNGRPSVWSITPKGRAYLTKLRECGWEPTPLSEGKSADNVAVDTTKKAANVKKAAKKTRGAKQTASREPEPPADQAPPLNPAEPAPASRVPTSFGRALAVVEATVARKGQALARKVVERVAAQVDLDVWIAADTDADYSNIDDLAALLSAKLAILASKDVDYAFSWAHTQAQALWATINEASPEDDG